MDSLEDEAVLGGELVGHALVIGELALIGADEAASVVGGMRPPHITQGGWLRCLAWMRRWSASQGRQVSEVTVTLV